MPTYPHFLLSNTSESFVYRPKPGGNNTIQFRDRSLHAQKLRQQFTNVLNAENLIKQQRKADSLPVKDGYYIEFVSSPNFELYLKSLENITQGIRLLNVRKINNTQFATVFIPAGKYNYFLKIISDYEELNTPKGKPKNCPLVTSIHNITSATLTDFWTDDLSLIPNIESIWIEVWIRISDAKDKQVLEIAEFKNMLNSMLIEYKNSTLTFPERAICLIKANKEQLVNLIQESPLISEFRANHETAQFWVNENNVSQGEWVNDLISRTIISTDGNVKICILDSGVNNAHPLLEPILSDNDCFAVDARWGTNDNQRFGGHGTLVAGIAGYGDLQESLLSRSNIELNHKLCSIKILPNTGSNAENLYGDITKQAISLAEIQNPNNKLIFSMTVTAEDKFGRGRPSAWSSSIDEIAYGDGHSQKLFLISAGNVERDGWSEYSDSNIVSSVQDPAQSWNALVIGAFTNNITITDNSHLNSVPIAKKGGLSPFSTTSNTWESNWPIKPDVLFEGGNLLKDQSDEIFDHADLLVLSTSKDFLRNQFDTLHATSAALAYASWFAAQILTEYPDAWPETIRALIVHSAEWTEVMKNDYGDGLRSKRDYLNLLRTCGYGVPNLNKALNGSKNAFTMILQDEIQPFQKKGSKNIAKDMNIHELKWPKDLLLSLGHLPVKMRITLSYFIEPSPGERGWKNKYRYQSHGLRFDLNSQNETISEFKKRINLAARDENEEIENISGRERWILGKSNRGSGSLHVDIWDGTAAQIATCNTIAVYPVMGWWRELNGQGKFNTKTRYSLVVSLITEASAVDIYTEVKNMISIPISILI